MEPTRQVIAERVFGMIGLAIIAACVLCTLIHALRHGEIVYRATIKRGENPFVFWFAFGVLCFLFVTLFCVIVLRGIYLHTI